MGEGNFGKVCLAAVSLHDSIRDKNQIEKEEGGAGSGLSRVKHRFSIRGRDGQNSYAVNKSGSDVALNEFNQPLLIKGCRKVAVKMVKGKLKHFFVLSRIT